MWNKPHHQNTFAEIEFIALKKIFDFFPLLIHAHATSKRIQCVKHEQNSQHNDKYNTISSRIPDRSSFLQSQLAATWIQKPQKPTQRINQNFFPPLFSVKCTVLVVHPCHLCQLLLKGHFWSNLWGPDHVSRQSLTDSWVIKGLCSRR